MCIEICLIIHAAILKGFKQNIMLLIIFGSTHIGQAGHKIKCFGIPDFDFNILNVSFQAINTDLYSYTMKFTNKKKDIQKQM